MRYGFVFSASAYSSSIIVSRFSKEFLKNSSSSSSYSGISFGTSSLILSFVSFINTPLMNSSMSGNSISHNRFHVKISSNDRPSSNVVISEDHSVSNIVRSEIMDSQSKMLKDTLNICQIESCDNVLYQYFLFSSMIFHASWLATPTFLQPLLPAIIVCLFYR